MRIARWRSNGCPGAIETGRWIISPAPTICAVRRGGLASPRRSLRTASAAKLKHDSDLFRNLPPRVRDGHKFESLARIYDSVAADLGKALVELSGEQLETLGPDYNTAFI